MPTDDRGADRNTDGEQVCCLPCPLPTELLRRHEGGSTYEAGVHGDGRLGIRPRQTEAEQDRFVPKPISERDIRGFYIPMDGAVSTVQRIDSD
jgi:hypothetical protein